MQGGGPALGPVLAAVVGLAVGGGSVAAGHLAATAGAGDQGSAHAGGHAAAGPPDIQGLGGRTQHHGHDLGVTGQQAGDLRVQGGAKIQHRRAQARFQFGQPDGEHDLGALPTGVGQRPEPEDLVGGLHQRIALALGKRPLIGHPVDGRVWLGQGVEQGADGGLAFGVELPPQPQPPTPGPPQEQQIGPLGRLLIVGAGPSGSKCSISWAASTPVSRGE